MRRSPRHHRCVLDLLGSAYVCVRACVRA
eukprot:COSAG06_NODE_23282_length_697_cov_0.734114_2_plen_28_part_01